ncbi:hypothetical protein ACCAA_350056 [Candidatus Accumulibacter aalborgensis]|uniref:Uncharacterized protein n=1 Tax=Candidatus Accumulibacter aalborgensis TaxID=1860102 RepID=A0A1A8XNB1_9PROT|nr:hypothetical protein ACCAA_350056 [Candidatus Accumulibacter aalborgensis]
MQASTHPKVKKIILQFSRAL